MMVHGTGSNKEVTKTYVFFRQFDDVKDYPLSSSLYLVIWVLIAYLLFVSKIGPNHMKNRAPYKLKNFVLIYNLFQVIASAYYTYLAYEILYMTGFLPKICNHRDPILREKMSYCIYVYWLGKVTELLDTILFVLRKKYNQVTFLHVYHHASTMFGTYLLFLYDQSASAIFLVFINSLVHVVMYFYYGLSGLGPEVAKYLFWKRHITNFQRVQFVMLFICKIIDAFFTICDHSIFGIIYFMFSLPLYFYLFTKFYNESYDKKST